MVCFAAKTKHQPGTSCTVLRNTANFHPERAVDDKPEEETERVAPQHNRRVREQATFPRSIRPDLREFPKQAICFSELLVLGKVPVWCACVRQRRLSVVEVCNLVMMVQEENGSCKPSLQ